MTTTTHDPACIRRQVAAVLTTNLILGLPAYFISFLFAYGFEDSVTVGNHLTFLAMIATFALLCGVAAVRHPFLGLLISLALNSAVVGLGSIVSALNKDQGSVSAAFSTTTDVLVAAGLLLVAAAFATSARRAATH